jgi:hypothetical protein
MTDTDGSGRAFVAKQETSTKGQFAPKPRRRLDGGTLSRLGYMALVIGALVAGAVAVNFAYPPSERQGTANLWSGFIFSAALFVGSGLMLWQGRKRTRAERASLTQLHASLLPERAKRAAESLQEATRLVEELKDELDARTRLLEDVKRQVTETTERAEEMETLGQVDEQTTRILNKYFDEALQTRLHKLERSAQRREWLLATVGAVPVGVLVILVAHYLFGL